MKKIGRSQGGSRKKSGVEVNGKKQKRKESDGGGGN